MTPDNSTSTVTASGVGPFTISHVTGSGSNRLLLVFVGINSASDRVSGITYNGDSLTRADYRNVGGVGIYAYYLIAPDTGTNDVVITVTSTSKCYVQIHTWSDAPQSGVPSATAGGAAGFQSSPRSDAITTPSGGTAVGAIFSADSLDFVVSGSGTEVGTAATDGSGRIETQSLVDATAIAWTWASGSKNMAATVLALPAAGGGGSTVTPADGAATVSAVGSSLAAATPTAAAGAATVSAIGGTLTLITSSVFKNNTGTVLASLTDVTAWVYNPTTGALVVKLTGQTTNASGVLTLNDAAIVSATTYRVVYRNEDDGAEGMETVTAS